MFRCAPAAAAAAGAFATLSFPGAAASEGFGKHSQVKELKYWNGRGLMDTPRMMMIMSGKEFKDTRVGDLEPLTPYGEIGSLSANLGRMPVICTPAGDIGQAAAINFFVASECDMMGMSTFEAATIISYCEHIKEMVGSYYRLAPYGTKPSPEILDKFFDSKEATDYTGPADMKKRSARYLRWYLGRLEAMAPADGYLVGGRISLADVELFMCLNNSLSPDQMVDPTTPAFRRENFADAARTQAVLQQYPKLAKVVANVGKDPQLQKWLAGKHAVARPKQGF